MKKRRLLSIILSLCMVIAFMPQMVFAETIIESGITITEGTFTDDVENRGTIDGGIFNGKVNNTSGIINGTFNGEVTNHFGGEIYGGTFSGSGNVRNSSEGTIYGGTFDAKVVNNSGVIKGGTFNAYVENVSAFIYDGTFYGTVDNEDGLIRGGTFYGTVDNKTGDISGGTFYGGIVNNDGSKVIEPYHIVSFNLNGGSGSIPKQWFVNIDTAQALEPAAPTRESYEFAGWYNGDTKYDFTQNVTENITLTAHWESVEVPVITVLENGKTYCDAVEFEVTDNVGVASVKAGDLELSPTNGKYTLEKGIGKVEVVAKDNAGNKTSVTVTVNNGHTGGTATCTQKAKCGICGEEYGELANHSLSKTDAKDATCTEDGNVEYWTCSVCHKLFSDENGTTETTQDAVTIRANGHTLNKIDAKEATAAETGNIKYWQCDNCKKYFADEKGENEITLDKTVISKLKPEIIDGKGQSITAGEKRALSFTSNAAFEDFKRVDLDGSELSEEYYEKAEGSIIITLDADYVATLSAGKHTIGIVSESGTAKTTFTVAEKAAPGTSDDRDKDSKSDEGSVKTGDNTNIALWLALMLLSGAGITGTTIYTRRKRTNE